FSCSTSQVVGAPMPLALAWCLFRSTQPHLRKQRLFRNRRVPVFPTSRSQAQVGTQNHQSRSENPGSGLAQLRISALHPHVASMSAHGALSDVAPDYVETSLLERRDHLAAAACWLPNFAGELWQMRDQCSRYPYRRFVLVE